MVRAHILQEASFPNTSEPPTRHIGAYGELKENGLFLPEVSVEEAQKMSGHLQTFPQQALGGPSQESAWA